MRHQTKSITVRAVAILLCLLLSPLPQFAQSNSRAGSVSALRTSVTKNSADVKAQDQIDWNDTLKTDANGRIRLKLDDGSILSVGTNSQLNVVRHDAKARQTQLTLAYGRMRSQVARLTQSGSQFEVRTPTAIAGVIGTDFFLDVTPTSTRLVVYEGVVTLTPIIGGVAATSQAVRVESGHTAEVTENGISQPQTTPSGMAEELIAETAIQQIPTTTRAAETAGIGTKKGVLIGVGIAAAIAGAVVGIVKSQESTNNNSYTLPQHPDNRD